jgi:hypothetical protein
MKMNYQHLFSLLLLQQDPRLCKCLYYSKLSYQCLCSVKKRASQCVTFSNTIPESCYGGHVLSKPHIDIFYSFFACSEVLVKKIFDNALQIYLEDITVMTVPYFFAFGR